MAEPEKEIWSETASMRDFFVNFPFWIIVIVLIAGAIIAGQPQFILVVLLGAAAYVGIVWLQRFNSRYRLTSQRLIVERGVLSHHVDEIELYRVVDSKSYESVLDHIVGLGTIEVMSSDKTGSIKIDKVPGAREKREDVRNLAEQMKQERNIRIISNIENVEGTPQPL